LRRTFASVGYNELASAVSLTRGDVAYMSVIVWAFAGIAVKHADTPVVTTAAWVTTALTALLVVGARLRRQELDVSQESRRNS
jgi:hypothetical protein